MSPRRLGQHFLADSSWRARIVAELPRASEDVWVEIGAGHGEMTWELARKARRVVAVELDPRLIEPLRKFTAHLANVEVVAENILQLDLSRLAGHRFKIYGNLPYYITSPILHRLFESAAQLDFIAVVVQLEVAARLVAKPGGRDYGYLSVLTQFYMQPELVLRIPPGAFRPSPKVTSALVVMRPPGASAGLHIADDSRFLRFVHACFAQKRKTLANNLRSLLPSSLQARQLIESVGLAHNARAEQLSIARFADLFHNREQLL